MQGFKLILLVTLLGSLQLPETSIAQEEQPQDFIIYSVRSKLWMGHPGEKPLKDFYVNMGLRHGLQPGQKLQVIRRLPTYDLQNRTLYKEVSFPIARLQVIHVSDSAAVARLEQVFSEKETPLFLPRAVMIGDTIEVAGE